MNHAIFQEQTMQHAYRRKDYHMSERTYIPRCSCKIKWCLVYRASETGAGSVEEVSRNTPELPTVESASQNRPEHSIGGILALAGDILAKWLAWRVPPKF